MCTGGQLIGATLQSAGAFMEAATTAAGARNQAQVANEQLRVDIKNERIKGMQEGNARQEEYLRSEAANRVAAAIGANGGKNFSFEQGVAEFNKRAMQDDMRVAAFNTDMTAKRMKYEIRVNRYNAEATARSAYIGAVSDTLSAFGSAAAGGGPTGDAVTKMMGG